MMRPLIYPLLFALIGVVADRIYLITEISAFNDNKEISTLVNELVRFLPDDEGQIVTLWLERDKDGVLKLKWDKSPRGYHSKAYRIHGAQAVEIIKD